ncbi:MULTISPECIES: STAS domain-containing protein [unclassified Streptomyces]|uniref:STAS domain-containing protein n=1 Tax=unclassified Streptomyces TaxID=2593676 RepID=UPI002E2B76D8|nr:MULTISPECIES: STAS domain-containing protein [unclassified Streptomyces]
MAAEKNANAAGGRHRRFSAAVRWSGRTAVVVVAGELDHDNPDPLNEAMGQALAKGAERIVVDCDRLTFCDSTGLNILLKGRLEVREVGAELELATLQPVVARMLEITGATGLFTVHAHLPDELR